MKIILSALEIIANILNAKGQFLSIKFQSEVTTSAKFKNVKILKVTKAVVRAGINFANLATVKEGIENGERGAVGSLPWGEWIKFPYLIGHKGNTYVRLYPSPVHIPHVEYFVNSVKVAKTETFQYLTPSKIAEMIEAKAPECFTLNHKNILDITE